MIHNPLHSDGYPLTRSEASRILSGHTDHRTHVKAKARDMRKALGLPEREALR